MNEARKGNHRKNKNQMETGCGGWFLWIWIIGWTTFVVIFDVLTVSGLFQQAQTTRFLTAEGVVRSSKVNVTRDSDGESRTAEINYEYQVDGQTYQSDTITLNGAGFSSADDLVKEFPAGAKPVVYYNPNQHSQSVLRTGLAASDFFVLIFLTPFNAIAWVGSSFLLPIDRLPLGPHSITRFQEGMNTRFRIRQWFTFQAGGATAGVAGFVCIFVVMIASYWIKGWAPVAFGFGVIGIGGLLGTLFLAGGLYLEVDPVNNRIKLINGDKEHSIELEGGPKFKSVHKKLTIASREGEASLPAIDFYSNTARDWLEAELKTLIRD